MKSQFAAILFLIFPGFIFNQSLEIKGTVKDSDRLPISYANVLLFRSSDSLQVKGSSADDLGIFVLSDLPSGAYFLQIQFFGYQEFTTPIDLRTNQDLGELLLEQEGNELEEVIVSGSRPTIERKTDRVIFRVENTQLSAQSTWDILRKAPGVIVIQDKLEIRGQEATVYINDRRVQLDSDEILDLLKGLSGDMIASVEIIPNPPAGFDAEGGPVLNIKTRQNLIPGYKGSIRSEYEQAIFAKYSLGSSQFFKGEKWGILANYGINPRKEFKHTDYFVNFFDPTGDVYAKWNTAMDRTNRSLAQQANIMLDIEPGKQDRLSLAANISNSPNKTGNYRITSQMNNAFGILDSTLTTQSALEDDKFNLTSDLSYEHPLRKTGSNLKANLHYTTYGLDRTQEGNSAYYGSDSKFLRNFAFSTAANQDIKIATGQLDVYTPITNGTLEAGLKGSVINSTSRIDYLDVNNTRPPFDIALSDKFNYEEKVGAAYASLAKKWTSWSMKLGLRVEQTEVNATSLTLNQINKQRYFQPFPNINLTRNLGESSSMTVTYNRKLTRPNYQDLNPFRFFVNENDYDQGNPNLVPNYSKNFNFNLNVKNTLFLDFYYRDNGRYISPLSFQDNRNQVLMEIFQNVEDSHSFGVDLTLSKRLTNFWDLYVYTSVFHEDETFLDPENLGETLNNQVDGLYAYISNDFTLSKDGSFTGEASVLYLSGFLYGTYKMTETTTLNLGLRKSIWNGRAVMSLLGEDLLYRANARYISTYRTQDNGYAPLPESRLMRLGFTYNFGNYRLNSRSANIRNAELQRIEED
ncbi:MAG: hypothetical protein RLZZ241_2491 [Bacteroidota bacterium]|jgi:hypothetical protein